MLFIFICSSMNTKSDFEPLEATPVYTIIQVDFFHLNCNSDLFRNVCYWSGVSPFVLVVDHRERLFVRPKRITFSPTKLFLSGGTWEQVVKQQVISLNPNSRSSLTTYPVLLSSSSCFFMDFSSPYYWRLQRLSWYGLNLGFGEVVHLETSSTL